MRKQRKTAYYAENAVQAHQLTTVMLALFYAANALVELIALVSATTIFMGLVGVIFLLGGLYFLIVDPASAGSSIINIQKMAIGETFSIVGAIFIAAQWRPPK